MVREGVSAGDKWAGAGMLLRGFYFLHTQQIISDCSSQEVQTQLECESAGPRGTRKGQSLLPWQGGLGKQIQPGPEF